MILLKLELRPVSSANKFLFFMVARLISGAAALFVLLFVHLLWGFLLLALWLLLTVGYYFHLHRLALAVFSLVSAVVDQAQQQPEG